MNKLDKIKEMETLLETIFQTDRKEIDQLLVRRLN